jgi:hypothetical protein
MNRNLVLCALSAVFATTAARGDVYPTLTPPGACRPVPYTYVYPQPRPVTAAAPEPKAKPEVRDGQLLPAPKLDKPEPPPIPATPGEVPSPNAKAQAKPDEAFTVYPVAADKAPPAGRKSATIGFYNHTRKEVQLTIDKKSQTLPPGGFIELDLPLTFNWRAVGGEEQTGKVPADAAGLEIVIRK